MKKKKPKNIWAAPSGTGHAGWEVTPEDIRQAREAAIAAGADREELERAHAELVKDLGSEEAVAREWTKQLWMDAYREQLGPSGQQRS